MSVLWIVRERPADVVRDNVNIACNFKISPKELSKVLMKVKLSANCKPKQGPDQLHLWKILGS